MDWASYYPAFSVTAVEKTEEKEGLKRHPGPLTKDVTIADIGCGFGGLLVALAPKLSDELLIGTTPNGCANTSI